MYGLASGSVGLRVEGLGDMSRVKGVLCELQRGFRVVKR